MKFSSTSLIAVALAAIVGSAIAAPCPLDARESVDLFKRQPHVNHQEEHRAAAEALLLSSEANAAAAEAASVTSQGQTIQFSPEAWRLTGRLHHGVAKAERNRAALHSYLSTLPHPTHLHILARTDPPVARHNYGVGVNMAYGAVQDRRH